MKNQRVGMCVLALALIAVPSFAEDPPGFALEWGEEGAGQGQFDEPVDVAVNSLGNVYVVDQSNHRIQKFN